MGNQNVLAMSTTDDESCPYHSPDREPTTDTNSHPDPNLQSSSNKHHTVITKIPETQKSDIRIQLQQQPLPSFDIAHHGWDASNVSTAKCDLCHRQRCGTLQKCRVCKLSICQECCVNGRLQNDRRHTIVAATVDWDAPPNIRKRKRQAQESREEPSLVLKRTKVIVRRSRGRGHDGASVDESRGISASSVMVSDEAAVAAAALDSEVSWQRTDQLREHGPDDSMEHRLSVTPESYNSSISRTRRIHSLSLEHATRHKLETASASCGYDDGSSKYWVSLDGEDYPAASGSGELSRRPVSQVDNSPLAAPYRPTLPPISSLIRDRHTQYHHPTEVFHTRSGILSRVDHLLQQQQQQQQQQQHQPLTRESWPLHEHTESLGTSLANAALSNHASSQPQKPLDHCLRDELEAVWASRAFIAHDPDAGRRYRRLLAAAYFASTRLGLEPRGDAVREWLREEERRMREMGLEPTRTARLMDFIQEVGIWYLRQAQC